MFEPLPDVAILEDLRTLHALLEKHEARLRNAFVEGFSASPLVAHATLAVVRETVTHAIRQPVGWAVTPPKDPAP